MTPGPRELGSDDVIAAARALAPALKERAAETDRTRRVPDASFDAIQDAGLFHTLKPRRYGGFELGLYEYTQIGMELSRGCASTGWIYSVLSEHCWFISMYPAEAQEEVWGENSHAVAAGSLAANPAKSQVARVSGGYRISGRFGFASGSDHAQWLLLGAMVPPHSGDGPAEPHLLLVRKSELEMIDDWFVLGLRGTGSNTYVASDVFVPAHRVMKRTDLYEARGEGIALHPAFDLLRAPRSQVAPFVNSAPTIGMALGAVDTFEDVARDLRRKSGRVAQSEAVKLALAESAAEADAARYMMETDTRAVMRHARDAEPIPVELQVRLTRDAAYVGRLARQCIDRLHGAVGASGIFDTHPLQRAMRDVHTALAQASMHWESRAQAYADLSLGIKNSDELTGALA
ncbi:acyl-CoA dehydrogenase family protein [Nocardia miyunensis]|uniref:acyl-CoA dehydrogenase family protein n=1 Tax=Nocardia miyunensis TaxID=282684 RepID=UPI00082A80E0|nr:acyl-CoA dehydrogenase family protein [Nocardia miyunensis]